jgi:type IV pilus assembly protein PilY1
VETTDNSSATLREVIQETVNQENWCGGNALSLFVVSSTNSSEVFRETESFEGNTGAPPKLKYSYESGSEGCYVATETAQAGVEGDDAEQDNSGATTIFDIALDLGVDTVGVRFQGVDIPQNARILEADILFSARNSSGGFASFNIKGELPPDGNANIFQNTNNNISNRNFTSTLPWIPEEWTTGGELYATPNLTTIVQAMVNNNNWEPGNAMVFVVEPGTGARLAESNNSDPSKGPRIRIRYEDIAPTQFKTVRDRLIEVIDDLPADGNTPITETMLEAALYWRGEKVKFGLNRDSDRVSRISHPGSYCITNANDTLDCRGADVNSNAFTPGTDQFGVQTPVGCNTGINPNDSDCQDENIKGEATYISPFNSELSCQNNYQILLTDGAANSSSGPSRTLITNLIDAESCLANNSTIKTVDDIDHDYGGHEQCSVDLVKFLNEEDQSTADVGDNLKNKQIIRTHTIAFNLDDPGDQQFLKDMARVGDGNQYTAVTAGELTNVFNNILTEVRADPTSFVSPSLATNAFNRLLSRAEVYFGLFTPQLNTAWPGNVKKYGICLDSSLGCELGTFIDANGDQAIDPDDNKFKVTAQSFWSDVVDGRATTEGGYGAEVTDFTQSVIFTEIAQGITATPSTPLNDPGYQLTSANWAAPELADVRNAVCSVPDTSAGSDCEDRMLWLLGKVINPDLETDISNTQRWTTNDVLHSSPTILTYGGEDDDGDTVPGEPEDSDGIIDSFFDKIIVGTNDGSIHMVNGSNGSEEWRFIPSDFLEQQQTLFTDPQATHIYGLDLTPTVYNNDVDGNGVIETLEGDFIKVYAGARRGGKFLYALDVSGDISSNDDTIVPKFLWKIQGGVDTGFERLGYTWSQPRLADISTTAGVKKVLILGGGFDLTQDSADNYSPADNGGDFLGNAIFIIDPETGAKILSISGSGSGADIEIPEMQFSIPSRISVNDSNADGVDDRLYVGDTGGQLWRVDLGSDIQSTGGLDSACLATDPATCTSTIVGRLANLSDISVDAEKRRFFEPPSVVQVRDAEFSDQTDYDYILIGSGYRAHPLNTSVNDRFYAVRDRYISPLLDDDGDHYSELTDGYADGSGVPIGNAGLINATTSVLDTSDATRQSDGWFFDFTEAGFTGEKVLSTANAIAGGVTFTTFRPGNNALVDPCEGTVGNSTAYNFNILNANAFLDWDGDGDIEIEDRSISLGGGIPSDVVPVFTQEGVVGIVGIEGGASQLGVLSGLPRFRTYWYEE